VGALSVTPLAIIAVVVVVLLVVSGGSTGDQEAVNSLAQRSIDVLPQGEWPSLYDSFTSEFRQRCPRDEFDQSGVDVATQLGDDLPFLKFKRLEDTLIQGDNARAVIVAEFPSRGEYNVQAAFRKEGGDWKIAPAARTEGCQAFQQLP
jgi:hypothetical protein